MLHLVKYIEWYGSESDLPIAVPPYIIESYIAVLGKSLLKIIHDAL
jgi:hypothetical protein